MNLSRENWPQAADQNARSDSPEAVVRSSRFVPPPRAEATPQAPILCLAATLKADQASDVNGAVLARLAEPGCGAETVVLALDGDIDAGCLEAMCALQECLRARGTRLRLVIETSEVAWQSHALTIHPSLRSAVLAAYAALPGPGLVNAQIRAALSVSAERVRLPARIARDEERMGGTARGRP